MPIEPMATTTAELDELARRIRVHVVKMAGLAPCHTGGSLSAAELLAALYFRIMRVDPQEPRCRDRDYLILSKGHAVPALDAALAMRGFFGEELLPTHLQRDSLLLGHPCSHLTPGVDAAVGSLGHGLSIAVGMALAFKMDRMQNRVFIMLGDGELQEGSNWEAAMSASHHKLDNMTAIVDRNMYQTGATEEIMALEPLRKKWESFGWIVRGVDGHDMTEVVDALEAAPFQKGRPSCVIADTVKGKGVSFLLNRHLATLTEDEVLVALAELGEKGA